VLGEGVGMRGIIVSESCPIISEIYHTHTLSTPLMHEPCLLYALFKIIFATVTVTTLFYVEREIRMATL
jgi:hypothetical protein